MVTGLILLVALGILGWGLYRARPFGKLGILAWLQSVSLMLPWLLFFGLSIVGIYLNLAGILFLFVASIGLYIVLGNRLRAAGADAILARKFHTTSDETLAPESPEPDAGVSTDNATAAPDSPPPLAPKPTPLTVDPDVVPIPADDLVIIKTIFGVDTFFSTETIPYQNGAIFKGNLRGEVEPSMAKLTDSLNEKLGDRYRLFLLAGPDTKPVVVVLPSSSDPKPMTLGQKLLALGLAIATLATCLEAAGFLLGFDLLTEVTRLGETLPIGLGIVSILAVHELGHRLMAARHQIRLSAPFFIPTWQIGSFGALTRFESLLPNRSVLFDVAFAGPAAGGLLSLFLMVVGLLLSQKGSLFQIPAEFFQGSILVGTLSRVILGPALQQPLVDIHPLMVVGWLGLVVTAINFLPAGQLDGGRIVQAIYGRRVAGRLTVATLIVLGLAALVNPLALYWAIVILFLQRDLERPALNDLSEPNDARAALALLGLFLTIATLLPLTPSLAGRLGIGG